MGGDGGGGGEWNRTMRHSGLHIRKNVPAVQTGMFC